MFSAGYLQRYTPLLLHVYRLSMECVILCVGGGGGPAFFLNSSLRGGG